MKRGYSVVCTVSDYYLLRHCVRGLDNSNTEVPMLSLIAEGQGANLVVL